MHVWQCALKNMKCGKGNFGLEAASNSNSPAAHRLTQPPPHALGATHTPAPYRLQPPGLVMPRLLSIELERGKEGSAKGWLLAFCVYIGFLVRKHEIFDEVHTASRTEFHGIYTCPTAVPFAFALLNFLNFGLDMSLSLKLVRRGPNADGRWVRDDGSTNPSLSPPPAQCMPGPAPHCAAGRFAWRGGAQTCTKWARVCVRVSVCVCVCTSCVPPGRAPRTCHRA